MINNNYKQNCYKKNNFYYLLSPTDTAFNNVFKSNCIPCSKTTPLISALSSKTILLSIRDEGTLGLNNLERSFLQSKNSSLGGLAYRGSYIGIWKNGSPIWEQHNNEGIAEHLFETAESQSLLNMNLKILLTSKGQPFGDHSSININDIEYSKNERGINIIELSPNGEVENSFNIDTFLPQEVSYY